MQSQKKSVILLILNNALENVQETIFYLDIHYHRFKKANKNGLETYLQ